MHTPGLKVVTPATVADAYSLLREAIADPDPVVFLEPKKLYWSQGRGRASGHGLRRSGRPRSAAPAATRRWWPTARRSRWPWRPPRRPSTTGWDLEVVDLRTLVPFDDETVTASVRRTGRCVVVQEAAGLRRRRRRDRRPGAGALLPLAARTGPAGQRLRHPVSAADRRAVPPARCRPGSRHGRPAAVGRRARPPLGWRTPHDLAPRTTPPAVRRFSLPDLGEGLTEAEIVAWRVAEGDEVEVDHIVVEVETAKATVEVPCPYAGRSSRCTARSATWSPSATR